MSILAEASCRYQEKTRKEREEGARMLSHSELLASAYQDFNEDIQSGKVRSYEVRNFVENNVMGARVNGVDVLSLDFSHSEMHVNRFMQRYMNSKRTRVVVAEYFYPELKQNAEQFPKRLVNIDDRLKQQGDGFIRTRLFFSRSLASTCQDAKKPVVVADIANKPLFELLWTMYRFGGLVTFLGSMPLSIYQRDWSVMGAPSLLAAWNIHTLWQEGSNTGIFSSDSVPLWDRFFFDVENARRLYLAKGIEQLTHEYSSGSDNEHPQIVMVYPKAHGMRALNYLTDPHPVYNKFQNILYKCMAPGLDFSVRTWSWKESLERLNGYQWGKSANSGDGQTTALHDSLAGWRLVSNRKIKI